MEGFVPTLWHLLDHQLHGDSASLCVCVCVIRRARVRAQRLADMSKSLGLTSRPEKPRNTRHSQDGFFLSVFGASGAQKH